MGGVALELVDEFWALEVWQRVFIATVEVKTRTAAKVGKSSRRRLLIVFYSSEWLKGKFVIAYCPVMFAQAAKAYIVEIESMGRRIIHYTFDLRLLEFAVAERKDLGVGVEGFTRIFAIAGRVTFEVVFERDARCGFFGALSLSGKAPGRQQSYCYQNGQQNQLLHFSSP